MSMGFQWSFEELSKVFESFEIFSTGVCTRMTIDLVTRKSQRVCRFISLYTKIAQNSKAALLTAVPSSINGESFIAADPYQSRLTCKGSLVQKQRDIRPSRDRNCQFGPLLSLLWGHDPLCKKTCVGIFSQTFSEGKFHLVLKEPTVSNI